MLVQLRTGLAQAVQIPKLVVSCLRTSAGSHRLGPAVLNVVASWSGSVHNSRIFDTSRVQVLYEDYRTPKALQVDMGYACQPFSMTPS